MEPLQAIAYAEYPSSKQYVTIVAFTTATVGERLNAPIAIFYDNTTGKLGWAPVEALTFVPDID
jgi:hypothetical protein